MTIEAVLSTLTGRQVEVFYVLLLSSGRYTFLPELYDIFGRESTIRFLEIFAGCRVAVPKLLRLEKLARAATIYVRIERAPGSQQPAIVHALADEYSLSEDRIRAIYAKTKVKFEKDLGLKIVKRRGI